MLSLEDKALTINIAYLQAILASTYVLATTTRNFHWNVKGENFMMFHELFGKLYSELNDQADEIAERVRQLGGTPIGTLTKFVSQSVIGEKDSGENALAMVNTLIEDNEALVKELRTAIPKAEANKDFGTMDLATKWMELHEKHLYFLRAHTGK